MSGVILTALLALGQGDSRGPTVTLGLQLAPRPDLVLRWNELLLQAIRTSRTPPPLAARNLGMVHVAVYDAVNAVTRTHHPALVDVRPVDGASAEAAAAAAAHRVLVALYPEFKQDFDEALAADLAAIPAGGSRDCGRNLGVFVGDRVLEWRQGDGAEARGRYTARTVLGAWRPTAPGYLPPLLPAWGRLRPFAAREGDTPRPAGVPPLGSPAYVAAFREVRDLGGRDSTTRTPEQTEIARFWADDVGTATPPGHWNVIARDVSRARGLTPAENARLFALLNITLADAGICCWQWKFAHDFWRPITAIRATDETGNPQRPADPGWTPLLTTPPFPAYTSGHSTFSSAAAAALACFFGTDRVLFESTSEGLPGVRRSFAGFWAAAEEAGKSRIYGGIHWEFDNAHGLASGRALAEFICRHYLKPRSVTVSSVSSR